MKKITLLIVAVLFGTFAWSQCTTGGAYQGAALSNDGSWELQSGCNYTGEYSNTTGVMDGDTYSFRSEIATDFITVTSSDGAVVYGFGVTPLTLAIDTSADLNDQALRVYYHDDAACGTTSACRDTEVRNDTVAMNSCPDPTGLAASNMTDSTADLAWSEPGIVAVSYNVEVYATGESAANGDTAVFADAAVAGTSVMATGLAAASDFDAYITTTCSGTTANSMLVGPVTFSTTASCSDVTDVAASNITSAGADISWTAGTGNDSALVEVYAAGESAANGDTAVYSNAAAVGGMDTATGLMGDTAYDAFVTGQCGATGTTAVGPTSFTTACDAITPDYTADMSVNVPDACWNEAGSGDSVSGPMDLGASDWRQGTSYALGSSNAINLYSNVDSEWLLSPSFDLSTGGPYQLEINVAVTNWNAGTVDDAMGSDDEAQLLMSTDNGTSWTNVTTWNAANEPPVGGIEYVEDLTAITGNVMFAVWATDGAVNDPEDYDFHVGKFRVRAIPACADPATVMNSTLTDTAADFTWTTGGTETTWEYANLPSPSTEPASGTSTMTSAVSFTGLTPETDYDFYVRSDCGGTYSAWVLISYTTPMTPPANDECDNAVALCVNADLDNGIVTAGTTVGASASAQADDVTGTPNTDVWYSFVATNDAHRVEILNVVNQGGGTSTSTDMGMGVYDGTGGCAALVFTDDSDPNTLDLTGLTIGTTYIVRVYGWYSSVQYNNFDISVGTPLPPPTPPANDDCDNAIGLTVNLDYLNGTVTAGTTVGATASTQADDVTGTPNTDVWFSFVAVYDAHRVELLNVVNQGGGTSTSTDMGMGVYDATGGCAGLVLTDDSDPDTLNLTGLVAGTTYYVRVYGWFTSVQYNNFDISVGSDPALNVNDVDYQSAFTYYPNPVKNTLTLSAQNSIEQVAMYNMLGQEVLRATPNSVDSDLDMSNLQTGTYFVKVTIANVTKTVRVIKQ